MVEINKREWLCQGCKKDGVEVSLEMTSRSVFCPYAKQEVLKTPYRTGDHFEDCSKRKTSIEPTTGYHLIAEARAARRLLVDKENQPNT